MVTTTVHLLRQGEAHYPARVLYGRLSGYHMSDRASARTVAEHLRFEDGAFTGLHYSEPAGALLLGADPVPGA